MKLFNRGRDDTADKAICRGREVHSDHALLAGLEAFGRFSYDPQNSSAPGDLEVQMYHLYQGNSDQFFATLATAAEQGGWIAYGAERLTVSVAGGDLEHPAYDVVMTHALAFLRAHGVPNSRLTGYEWSWWLSHDGASQPWLVGKPLPTADDGVISPLQPGEVRTIAQMTAGPEGNLLLLTQHEAPGQGYAVLVDGPWSDTDPTRHRNVWFDDADLSTLFTRVGSALQIPPHWVHPELQPYIPLSRPSL